MAQATKVFLCLYTEPTYGNELVPWVGWTRDLDKAQRRHASRLRKLYLRWEIDEHEAREIVDLLYRKFGKNPVYRGLNTSPGRVLDFIALRLVEDPVI